MPNIFTAFSRVKAESYQFPKAEELVVEPDPEDSPPVPEEGPSDPEEQGEKGEGFDVLITDPEPEEEPEPELNPISFAQIQAQEIQAEARREADEIVAQARKDAERILAQAREDADRETQSVFAKAREEGYQEGYAAGMAQSAEESRQLREEQAKRLEEEVHRFMEHAGDTLDRQMDRSVDDLRDLALAVAEKVVCVSLKSSADVISRMIQTAIDKRKKKEWVHIYISECDAKRLTQIPASLSAALSALSDRVRIIPMSDDESGTCIIEMPDEIVDASASTQLDNLRTILMDTANSASGINLFH